MKKTIELSRFSTKYKVRRLGGPDIEDIYLLCSRNILYYQYCPPFVTRESIAADMKALPPKKDLSDKYYVGYYDNGALIAVLDLIVSYPDDQTAFIGFFMADVSVQKKGIGSRMIEELCDHLRSAGFSAVRLGWVSGNPQAEHFWHRNGFTETGITYDAGGYIVTVGQRDLKIEKISAASENMIDLDEGRLRLCVPLTDQLNYRKKILSDPQTMSYNRGYDLDLTGYNKDTGCIDFPESEWQEWYEYFIGHEPERFYAYIQRKEDDAFIGEVNVHRSCDEYYDMGIVIEARYRGKGYAKEALALLLKYAFENMGASAVHNDFEDDRTAAYKLHLACGFKEVGRKDGLIHLLITAEEYRKLSAF